MSGQGPGRLFGHTGGLPGAGAALRVQPSTARVAVALANQDAVEAPRLASQLLDATGPLCGPP